MEDQSSQALSAGPEEVEAAMTLLSMRYGSYEAIPFAPTVVSEVSPSTSPVNLSTPTILSASSSTASPISAPFNAPAPSPAAPPLISFAPSNAPPVFLGSTLTTSFTPINAPSRLEPPSSSLAAPGLLVEDEEDAGGEAETPATPSKLLAYFRGRKPSPTLRNIMSMLTHPTRAVYLPTSAKACDRCQKHGMECVTLPERKPCAFCASSTKDGRCSTAEERRSGMGQWCRGVSQAERAAKRKALDEMEGGGEDELEMGGGEDEKGETQPSPTQLLDYFRTRKPSNKLRAASALLFHPNRRVHPSTSPKACIQCREKGVECLTLPARAHCAYCVSRGGSVWYDCSTKHRRQMIRAKGNGERPRKRPRKESTKDEMVVDEEDAMEVEVDEDKENDCGARETLSTPQSVSTLTTVVAPISATPPLGSSSLAAPRLLAYLQSRNSLSRVRYAEVMLTHPSSKVYPSTSPRACTQCQIMGFECVILPFRMHCAYCTSHNSNDQYLCSTRKERLNGRGKWREEMERLRKEKVDDKAEVEAEIPNLLTYFRSRKPGPKVQRAERMLTDPHRKVHLPTSAEACSTCRQHGMECLTLPERGRCAFCVLRHRAAGKYLSCCTQDKRDTAAGKGTAEDEVEVDEGGDEDEIEVEEGGQMEVDTDVEEVESGDLWSAANLRLTMAEGEN